MGNGIVLEKICKGQQAIAASDGVAALHWWRWMQGVCLALAMCLGTLAFVFVFVLPTLWLAAGFGFFAQRPVRRRAQLLFQQRHGEAPGGLDIVRALERAELEADIFLARFVGVVAMLHGRNESRA